MKRFITAVLLLLLVLAFGMQISAAAKTYTMYVGRTYKIKQSGVKKWTSTNKKIATVGSKNGKIKPKKPGTVTIKAKKKRTTVRFQVIVKKPYISKTKLTLEKGKSATLKLTGTTAKSWKSSKSSVVSVTSKGKVKAKAAGTATITVRGSNKKTYQCRVTVPKPYVPPKQPEPTPQPEPETEPQMPEPGPFNGYLIMHRGYNKVAPENTLAAFQLAADMGFKAVECDIQFTKDGVPMILHDTTVTRTSNVASVEMELFGVKKRKLSELTFEEVRQLDFGSWKSEAYAGEKIPTFDEFLQLCQQRGLHPYIELKSNGNYSSKTKLTQLYAMVAARGMQNQVTWISFDINMLNTMKGIAPTAELGWLRSGTINPSTIAGARAIQLSTNKVYLMPKTWNLSNDMLKECWKYNIGLIAQSIYSQLDQSKMNSYYTAGITNGF